MPERCIFCEVETERFRPEHWVPQWLSRAVIGEHQIVEHHEYGRDEPRYARIFDLTVKRVCQDCNNHWMSDMETRTRNLALSLIRGEQESLSAAEQRRFAAWCFLKVLSLELGRPPEHEPTFPDAMYSGFHRFQHPPISSCAVLVGRRDLPTDDRIVPYIWFHTQGQDHAVPDVGDVRGYRTALAIGHLVVDVLGVFANAQLHVEDADPRLVRLWPRRSRSIRLPSERFEDIEDFVGAQLPGGAER